MKETAIVSICYNHKIAILLAIVEDNCFFTSWSLLMLLNLCIKFILPFQWRPLLSWKIQNMCCSIQQNFNAI